MKFIITEKNLERFKFGKELKQLADKFQLHDKLYGSNENITITIRKSNVDYVYKQEKKKSVAKKKIVEKKKSTAKKKK